MNTPSIHEKGLEAVKQLNTVITQLSDELSKVREQLSHVCNEMESNDDTVRGLEGRKTMFEGEDGCAKYGKNGYEKWMATIELLREEGIFQMDEFELLSYERYVELLYFYRALIGGKHRFIQSGKDGPGIEHDVTMPNLENAVGLLPQKTQTALQQQLSHEDDISLYRTSPVAYYCNKLLKVWREEETRRKEEDEREQKQRLSELYSQSFYAHPSF